MKSILNIYDLLPIAILLLQTVIFLLSTIAVLRYLKILQLPYAGMEYSKLVIAAATLLSSMFISFSDIEGVMQTVKTFNNYGDGFYRNLFIKFSHFILIIVLAECLFGFLCFMWVRIIWGLRKPSTEEDNMPKAILQGTIMLVTAILLYLCTRSIIETITPKYINFA